MVDFWSLVGYLAVSVASGAFTAVVCLLLGGLGGLRGLAKRLTIVEDLAEEAHRRVSKEQKVRASEAGVAARRKTTDADLAAAATQTLAENVGAQQVRTAPLRPSIVGRR